MNEVFIQDFLLHGGDQEAQGTFTVYQGSVVTLRKAFVDKVLREKGYFAVQKVRGCQFRCILNI